MKYNKKTLIYAAAVVAVLALAYYLYRRRQMGYTLLPTIPNPGTGKAEVDENRLLQQGSKGLEVSELQSRLKADGGAGFLGNSGPAADGVDGDFGPLTLAALREVKGVDKITLKEYDATTTEPIAANAAFPSSVMPNDYA